MASCGLIAELNLDLWLNQAWGGKPRIETLVPSEARSLLGLESRVVWLLGIFFACV